MRAVAEVLRPRAELPGGMVEEAVAFAVGDRMVRGNLALPAGAGARCGVLFLHGWGGARNGPHNLLTHFARAAAAAGYPTLRFDFCGRGESEGDGASVTLKDMAADALAAAQCLKSRAEVSKLILVGICSGGNVAIGVLDRLPETAGLFMLSVYPFSDGDSFGRDASRTLHFLRQYWRKLWMPATWAKLRRGDVDFRGVLSVLFGHFGKSNRDREGASEKETSTTTTPAAKPRPAGSADEGRWETVGANPNSPLMNLLKTRPPLRMTYGEADPDFGASISYYRAFAQQHAYTIEFATIPDANHNFYALTWKRELTAALLTFIEEHC